MTVSRRKARSFKSAAAQGTSRNVPEAVHATRGFSGSITDVHTAAGRTGESTNSVLDVAAKLRGQTDRLRIDVNDVLAKAQAA